MAKVQQVKQAPAKKQATKAKTAKKTVKMHGEVYYPSKQVVEQARLKDWERLAKSARKDLKGFWESEAKELEWFSKWKKILDDSKKPFFKWFTGAKVNIVHNCI